MAAKLQSVRLHEINSSDSGYIEAGIDDNGRVPPSLDSYSTKNKFWTAFVKKGDDNYNQTIKNATSLNTRGILDFGSKDGKQLKTILGKRFFVDISSAFPGNLFKLCLNIALSCILFIFKERKMLMVVDLTDEEMQQAFGLFDKDGSGTIQVSESPDLIKACGEDLTPFRASILFNLFDTDTSGALTFEEFKVTLNKQDDGLAEEVLKAFFRTVDEDVSGSLSRGEVKKFLRNASLMPGENSEEVAVDAVNNTFDLDGDFQIQYEEVVKVMKDSGTYFS